MATVRSNEKRTAAIVVANGVSSSGAELTKSISFSGVNGAAEPAALLDALQAFASLMDKTVYNYVVTDKDVLVDDANED